jgi:hypothetical protein
MCREVEKKEMSDLSRWSLPIIHSSRKSQDGSLWARLAQEEPHHQPPTPKGDKRPQGCMLALILGPAIHQLPRRETGRRRGKDPLLVGCNTLHSGQQTCMNKNKKRKANERKRKERSCRVSAWSLLTVLRTAPRCRVPKSREGSEVGVTVGRCVLAICSCG